MVGTPTQSPVAEMSGTVDPGVFLGAVLALFVAFSLALVLGFYART